MQTTPISSADLCSSVIAVPPLARDSAGVFDAAENARIIRHIEAGDVTTLLYGGNANFYHIALSEYESVLSGLIDGASENTLIVPAAGPSYGMMMDQAEILKDFNFPTVMVLPQEALTTNSGVATGLRHFAEKLGKPIVIYNKFDNYIDPAGVQKLVDDGLVSWIKYATVRPDPLNDAYLSELVDRVDPKLIISGIGEQPAIIHMRDFGLRGYTSGCVCIRPDLSAQMLKACLSEDWQTADDIRRQFGALEDLRNEINPVRVLHEAVELAGIATTGPHLPLLSGVESEERNAIKKAAVELLQLTA